jgi:hypothetical protein
MPLYLDHRGTVRAGLHLFVAIVAIVVVAVPVVWVQHKAATTSYPRFIPCILTLKTLTFEVGAIAWAIFHKTIYIPATTSASPGTRARAAGDKTGAFFPDAALRLGPFLDPSADSAGPAKNVLPGRR